uniref:Uncharacterized protein n=1 Tax=viral metagenome TaxID=1070528 RepID=A0A6C0BGX0_9ZZZZ
MSSTSFLGSNNIHILHLGYNNGYVGINTSNPESFLDVAGNATMRSNLTVYQYATFCNDMDLNGTLSVSKNASFESNVTILGQLTVSNVTYVTSNITVYQSEIVHSNLTVNTNATVNCNLQVNSNSHLYGNAYLYNSIFTLSNYGSSFISTSNNYIGIGTYDPSFTLDVNGSINATGYCNLLLDSYTSASTSNAPTAFALSNAYGVAVAASNNAFGTWSMSNNKIYVLSSNVGIGTSNATESLSVQGAISLSNYGKVVLYTSNNQLGVGRSNPRASFDITGGNIISKNLQKLTKSADNASNVTITVSWDNSYSASNQYFVVADAIQQISNGTDAGFRVQRLAIGISNQSLSYVKAADAYGDISAYSSLDVSIAASTSNSVTLQSATNWVTSGDLQHTFTVDVLHYPSSSNIGDLWLN